MRYTASLILFALLLPTIALAADKKKKAVVFDGQIVKIDKSRINFDAVDANGTAVHGYAYYDDKVKLTIDGKDASPADLRLGMHVVITMRNNQIANAIAADTPKKKEN